MIRAVLAHSVPLVRGALAHLLATERDIEVVAEVGAAGEVEPTAQANRPDVTVADLALLRAGRIDLLCGLRQRLAGGAVLVLAQARTCGLRRAISRPGPGVGYLDVDGSPDRLAESVRRVVGGEPVVDPQLAAAAERSDSPLTLRETDVLTLAAEGGQVRDIAARLGLSCGTVRNGLSRVIAKTGARNRVEAVRIAELRRWI